MGSNKIVVIGGGVVGLTTAYLLSKDQSNEITLAAKHMPGDYDIEYCSMWAGANYHPMGEGDTAHGRWEKNTWPVLKDLAQNHPEAGIHFQNSIVATRKNDSSSASEELHIPDPWYSTMVSDYRVIPKEERPADILHQADHTAVCINTPVYLAWLLGQCRKNGITVKRAVFKHISDAAYAHSSGKKADVVVNCTGLGARSLGGVADTTMYPIRGQVVVVRNDPGSMYSVADAKGRGEEICYMMMRAAGGGTVLGGTYQKHNWDSQPDPSIAVRLMTRCVQVCPKLVGKDENGKQRGIEGLDIIRHGVGLRPAREAGTRIEQDKIDGVAVVHNYGHSGFGYQASYGSCFEAVDLVNKSLAGTKNSARL